MQNIRKTTFNFWKKPHEKYQWHSATVPELCRVRVQEMHSTDSEFKSLPPKPMKNWLLIVVINNHGAFTTYETRIEFKQCYALYPPANCSIWTLGTAAVPGYTHSLVTGTTNTIPLTTGNLFHYLCCCFITSPP